MRENHKINYDIMILKSYWFRQQEIQYTKEGNGRQTPGGFTDKDYTLIP